ncbi:psbP domain-containing protein 3, chloroplastic isoform X2 [Beta vulgaris subsp. vulgaris]|uniref:psbP domain-containing protein 3, chloroplastic isoform X2 n=1 Tax=Beta vulgaris subsp. vulgaris TaxID=3555 RepID=UPI00203684A7|nr:psbP domain-containing protein 3, chloroplastic isoform X2 [Beta vulgaris subsp. vulgaris]
MISYPREKRQLKEVQEQLFSRPFGDSGVVSGGMMTAASSATANTTAVSFLQRHTPSSSFPFISRSLSFITRKQPVVSCCLPTTQQSAAAEYEVVSTSSGRREAMLHIAFSAAFQVANVMAVSSPALALAVPAEFRVYSDDANKYKISIPQDWQVGAGETDGIKSITAFYPEEASTSNVSVVITGIGPDFTKLESFGKVDAFAESLVTGLDRSWQRPPGVAAKLIDSKASNGLYYIEYTLQKPGESRRHIYSAIGMANNGWYNRLYTVTGQFVEDESNKFESEIQKAVRSFRLG